MHGMSVNKGCFGKGIKLYGSLIHQRMLYKLFGNVILITYNLQIGNFKQVYIFVSPDFWFKH